MISSVACQSSRIPSPSKHDVTRSGLFYFPIVFFTPKFPLRSINFSSQLILTALNSSKTAHASWRLDSNLFFEKYHYSVQSKLGRRKDEEASFTCQLSNKVALVIQNSTDLIFLTFIEALYSVFKSRLPDRQEKNTAIERCEVVVKDDPEKTACRIIVRMKCRHGRSLRNR